MKNSNGHEIADCSDLFKDVDFDENCVNDWEEHNVLWILNKINSNYPYKE